MKLCSFSRSLFALSLAVFITVVQRLTAPLPWLIVKPAICARCFPRWAPCCLETQRESRWGEESGGEGWTLIDKPHRQMNVSPLWVVKRWGNPTPPWNTFSTNLCTTKSTVSISSLPFNCSQLEHVAFWHGRAGDSHTHTHTHTHTEDILRAAWRCSRCAHFVVSRSNSFQSHESRGVSLSISSALLVRSVNLSLTFEQIWCDTPKMF